MRSRWSGARLQLKLLFSYLLVLVAALGAVALGMRLIAPSLFDQILMRHMDSGMMGGAMTLAMRRATDDAFQTTLRQSLLLALALASLVAVAVSVFVTGRITTPIRRMALVSQRIARGDYGARAEVTARDEIGDLARSLNRMAAELETTEQRRIQLIGDVAHELRTPIATLRGYLEGLQDGVVAPSDALWSQLQEQTGRLSRLVDDLRELSRVESGAASIALEPVAPDELVRASVAAITPRFAEKGVALSVSLAPNAPPVLADHDRAGQVLANLLTNALRYTPPGGSVIVSTAPGGSVVWFRVRDTGIGVPQEHLPRLFDRFYRVDPARSRALGGSGIGLAIARALVEAQGGEIRADSPGPNQGSTFSFSLPVAHS
ncbi:MAG TPA: ATP-binding protein [Nitrolancea sp.]|nr:ATP-binding protein [Nitrolancea sp.]